MMRRHLAPFTRRNTCVPSPSKSIVLMSSKMAVLALSKKNNAPFPTKASMWLTLDRTHQDLSSIMGRKQPSSKPSSRSPRTLRSTRCRKSHAFISLVTSWARHLLSTQTRTRSPRSRPSSVTVPTQCRDKNESLTSVNSQLSTPISLVRDTTEAQFRNKILKTIREIFHRKFI